MEDIAREEFAVGGVGRGGSRLGDCGALIERDDGGVLRGSGVVLLGMVLV